MKIRGDIESVNLRTGEMRQRVVGDGESVLVPIRGPVDFARLGPRRDVVFGPVECEPSIEEINYHVQKVLKQKELTMHYRNGREAKNGDVIVQIGNEGRIEKFGVLHSATPGNDYCNGVIAPVQEVRAGACMCDCLHVDDVAEMLKEKGLDKRPAGK